MFEYFFIGGISGAFATAVVQPIDTIKVQFQVISQQLGKCKNSQLTLSNIFTKIRTSSSGLKALYRGLDSAILRQLFYASSRIGAYNTLLNKIQTTFQRKSTHFQKIICSMISGAFGAIIGNPFDVALVRRQASIMNHKNNYRCTSDAFQSIVTQEGWVYLWRGINITICRVVVINLGQLAGKDIISSQLEPLNLSKSVHQNVSALLASVLTAAISLPVDNLKVKLQKQDLQSTHYRGVLDCLFRSIQREGFRRLWVGFPIYLIRGTPHSFILLKTQQYLTSQLNHFKSN